VGAAASVFALAPFPSTSTLAFGSLALLSVVGLYATLIRIFEPDNEVVENVQGGLPYVIRQLAPRTAGVLAILAVVLVLVLLPGSIPHMSRALVAGSVKAIHWTAMFWIVRYLKITVDSRTISDFT
jgi:hypothetical protein